MRIGDAPKTNSALISLETPNLQKLVSAESSLQEKGFRKGTVQFFLKFRRIFKNTCDADWSVSSFFYTLPALSTARAPKVQVENPFRISFGIVQRKPLWKRLVFFFFFRFFFLFMLKTNTAWDSFVDRKKAGF